ncbi:hypothetical protein [Paraburkholderia dilworthii]|uniref:hypothetical protein n=1 Tax=Paraburkholderia dilworthii TaxID=948106 RepID=UPI000418E36C|nr:hypothetical protein [Paraburkholderia dilworthii]
MRLKLIAAALFSLCSVAAMAGTGTTSSSSSTSGGQTSAAVSGFGSFRATDYGTANGNAQAIAGSGFGVTGNATNASTGHTNTSTVGGYGHGGSSATGLSGADAAANAWSSLGRGWH